MESPTMRALIDIGSNSLRLQRALAYADGSWKFLPKELATTRLGKDMDKTGRLSEKGLQDSLAVMARWHTELAATPTWAIATSAVREAADGAAFIDRIAAEFGWSVRIISGDEEAALSFSGAAFGTDSDVDTLVLDIGGGSSEAALGRAGQVNWSHSYKLGAVRLSTGRAISRQELLNLKAHCDAAWLPMPAQPGTVIGVGGTLTSLAAMDQEMTEYDPQKIQGYEISAERLDWHVERIFSLPLEERRSLPGLQPKRGDIILAGLVIAQSFLHHYGIASIRAGERDLMEGFFLQQPFYNGPDSV